MLPVERPQTLDWNPPAPMPRYPLAHQSGFSASDLRGAGLAMMSAVSRSGGWDSRAEVIRISVRVLTGLPESPRLMVLASTPDIRAKSAPSRPRIAIS